MPEGGPQKGVAGRNRVALSQIHYSICYASFSAWNTLFKSHFPFGIDIVRSVFSCNRVGHGAHVSEKLEMMVRTRAPEMGGP